MLDEDRYCVDILNQMAAIQAALLETAKLILAGHLDTCLTAAIQSGNARERRKKIDELVDVFARLWRTRARHETTTSRPSSAAARRRT